MIKRKIETEQLKTISEQERETANQIFGFFGLEQVAESGWRIDGGLFGPYTPGVEHLISILQRYNREALNRAIAKNDGSIQLIDLLWDAFVSSVLRDNNAVAKIKIDIQSVWKQIKENQKDSEGGFFSNRELMKNLEN